MNYNRFTVVNLFCLGGNNMKHSLNNSEWQIISYLWEESPKTMMDIVRKMEDEQAWSKSTTTTLLKRMLDKEYISYQMNQKVREYYPLLKHDEVIKEETESFVQRVFGGDIGLLMANLVSNKKPTKKELEELRSILDEAEKDLNRQ